MAETIADGSECWLTRVCVNVLDWFEKCERVRGAQGLLIVYGLEDWDLWEGAFTVICV